jgi:hypothetical protein
VKERWEGRITGGREREMEERREGGEAEKREKQRR